MNALLLGKNGWMNFLEGAATDLIVHQEIGGVQQLDQFRHPFGGRGETLRLGGRQLQGQHVPWLDGVSATPLLCTPGGIANALSAGGPVKRGCRTAIVAHNRHHPRLRSGGVCAAGKGVVATALHLPVHLQVPLMRRTVRPLRTGECAGKRPCPIPENRTLVGEIPEGGGSNCCP